MSTDITGWVEIKRNDRNDLWLGVVNILPIMNRNYLMFDFLFGGRSENYEEALAPLRRLQKTEVSRQAESGGNYESWIGLDQLLAIDWTQHQEIFSDDWQRLIQIMKLLAENDRVTEVRLIVNFF